MGKIFRIYSLEKIDDTGIFEEDYVENTLFYTSDENIAKKIEKKSKERGLDVYYTYIVFHDVLDDLLNDRTLKVMHSEEYEVIKEVSEELK